MAEINIKNRSIFCSDNLEVLENINSDTIDLIYLDPPFNKKKVFTAPIGSQAEGAEFSDIFRTEDVKDEWVLTIKEDNEKLHNFLNGVKNIDGKNSYNYCYLCYMAIRLIEMHRILKETGSLYLHCDPTMNHSLKMVLDYIFEEENFRNEIIWKRQTAKKGSQYAKRTYGTSSDILFFYTKSQSYNFSIPKIPMQDAELKKKFTRIDENGKVFRTDRITLPKIMRRENLIYEYKGFTPEHGWMVNPQLLKKMDKENRIFWASSGNPYRKYFADEYEGTEVSNIWVDISVASGGERTGYPTQKPLALLERIIKASSNEGDIVLDPFCGCATTCVASEKLGRQWIGIDVSKMAFELVKERLNKEIPIEIWDNKTINFYKTKNLKRTDGGGKEKVKKYIYIISNPSEKPFLKVGIAKDIRARLSSYQTSDKDRAYEIKYTYLTEKYREIEKHIHEKFENLHEWVKAKKEEIIFEIENFDKR